MKLKVLIGLISMLSIQALAAFDPPAIRAQLRPVNHAVISAGLSGKLAEFRIRAGDTVAQDQLIAKFDCDRYLAQRDMAVARLNAAEKQQLINTRLAELENISDPNLIASEAELNVAQAEIRSVNSILAHCEIRAPFHGQLTEKHAESHEYVQEGTPLFEIIDTSHLEVEMVIASKWLERFRIGSSFKIRIEETDMLVDATVQRIIGSIDPVSQTIKVIGQLEEQQPSLLPGMSGRVILHTTP